MADSTVPILTAGGITVANRVVFQSGSLDWKIPIATGFAVVAFAGLEKMIGPAAVTIAWIAAFTALVVPYNGKSFIDDLNTWLGNKTTTTSGKGTT